MAHLSESMFRNGSGVGNDFLVSTAVMFHFAANADTASWQRSEAVLCRSTSNSVHDVVWILFLPLPLRPFFARRAHTTAHGSTVHGSATGSPMKCALVHSCCLSLPMIRYGPDAAPQFLSPIPLPAATFLASFLGGRRPSSYSYAALQPCSANVVRALVNSCPDF
jgi:hypothetical protein